jgi:putative peptidoglycan lipid II flippase
VLLYIALHRRGWFRFTARLGGRVARQAAACAVMAVPLWWLVRLLDEHYAGTVFERVWSLAALVLGGGATFFAAAWALGALDKDLLAQLRRRRPPPPDDAILEVT